MFGQDKSPYSTGLATDAIQHSLPTTSQENKYSDEWKKRLGDKKLPHELQHIPDLIAPMVDNGVIVAGILQNAIDSVKHQSDEDLQALQIAIEKMIDYLIMNVDPILAKTAI